MIPGEERHSTSIEHGRDGLDREGDNRRGGGCEGGGCEGGRETRRPEMVVVVMCAVVVDKVPKVQRVRR